MKPSLIAIVLGLACMVSLRGAMVPSDLKKPLFQIYEIQPLPDQPGADPRTHKANLGKLLLTVFLLRDVQFLPGDGAQVTLSGRDAKAFSRLTHTHEYLFLVAGDQKSAVTMHISGPIDDGVIPFGAATFSTEIARYLRHRFHETPNQAMQRTASKPAIHVLSLCRPHIGCEPRFTGLAVADLGSR